MVLLRRHRPTGRGLLVVVNWSDRQPVTAGWTGAHGSFRRHRCHRPDERSRRWPAGKPTAASALPLAPGQVLLFERQTRPTWS